MPLRPNMEPGDFLDILRRRKWIILYAVLLVLFGATVYCVMTPELYQSSVKFRIIPPVVPEGLVRSAVNVKTKDRLAMLEQEVISRPRVKGMIVELGLSGGGDKGVSADEMVESIRKGIILNVRRNNTFVLSFEHEDPKIALDVTSRLASFFIEENARSRGESVQGTAKFLESQLEETRKKLEEQEDKLKRYKLQYGGELPEQMNATLGRLARLQDKIKSNSEAITRMEDRKVFIETQISNLELQIQGTGNFSENVVLAAPKAGAETSDPARYLLPELSKRRKKLEDFQAKYTPLHPSVLQARQQVEQLEARIAEIRQAVADDEAESAGDAAGSSTISPKRTNWEAKEMRRLREKIATIDFEIGVKEKENAQTAQIIDSLQAKVERLPQREQELISLTRDYGNTKNSYDELLKKRLQANISENLEENQQGEQFMVVEPATLPTRPIKPDRLKILAIALMGSLVIGAGGAIGLETIDPTLRGSKDFKSYFSLPVLASLPVIQDDRYKRQIAVRRAAVIGGLVSIAGAYVIFLAVHAAKVKSIVLTIGQTIGGGN